jgi:hypothetical protein
MKIAVLAGNHSEYNQFISDLADNIGCSLYQALETFQYIDSIDKARGYRFIGVVVYGTYYERPNIDEIRKYILYNIR